MDGIRKMYKVCLILMILCLMFSITVFQQVFAEGKKEGAKGEQPANKEIGFSTFSGPNTHAEFTLRMVEEWGKENGYKINSTVVPYVQLRDKIMVSIIAQDQKSDIYYVDSGSLPLFAKGLQPLNDLIKQENHDLGDISKSLIQTFTVDDQIYSIPHESDTPCMVFRADLFEDPIEKANFKKEYGRELKPPKDFDEMLELAQFFTREKGEKLKGKVLDEDFYGVGLAGRTYISTTRFFQMFLHGAGGKTFDENLFPIFNNEAGQHALSFWSELILKHKVAVPGVLTTGAPEIYIILNQGRAAFSPSYPEIGGETKEPSYIMAATSWYPSVDKAWAVSIARHSNHKEAAWEIIKYLNTKENQLKFGQWGGSPTRTSVLTDQELVSKRPIMAALADVHKNAYVQPQIPELAYVWDIQAEPLADVITGEKSVSQALDNAVQKVYELLKKAGYYEGKTVPPNIPKP